MVDSEHLLDLVDSEDLVDSGIWRIWWIWMSWGFGEFGDSDYVGIWVFELCVVTLSTNNHGQNTYFRKGVRTASYFFQVCPHYFLVNCADALFAKSTRNEQHMKPKL